MEEIYEGIPNDRLNTAKPATENHNDKGMNMHIIVQRQNYIQKNIQEEPGQ